MSLVMKMKMTKLLMRWEEIIFVEYLEHPIHRRFYRGNVSLLLESMNYVAMLTGEDYGNEGGLTGGITFQIGESFLYFYLCKECLIIQTSMQSA